MSIQNTVPANFIQSQVKLALLEDVGQGDLTAKLIPEQTQATATLISRQEATLCGIEWFDSVFKQLDPMIKIDWKAADGDRIHENQVICELNGSAQNILCGERTAMNFLQTLSGTATAARRYSDAVAGITVQILDTRKTIPGYRLAQKYATRCGGCYNHRFGLYDAVLIKENHIQAAGSIKQAIDKAKALYEAIPVETEVENLEELTQAIEAQADIVLLDNFSLEQLREAVTLNAGKVKLEASGGVNLETVRAIAETGVDRISVGSITKDIQAVDLSMRFK